MVRPQPELVPHAEPFDDVAPVMDDRTLEDIDRMHESLRGQGERLGGLAERIAKAEQRLDGHSTRIHGQDTDMTTVLLKVGIVEGKLEIVDKVADDLKAEVTRREAQGIRASEEHGKIHARMDALSERIGRVRDDGDAKVIAARTDLAAQIKEIAKEEIKPLRDKIVGWSAVLVFAAAVLGMCGGWLIHAVKAIP